MNWAFNPFMNKEELFFYIDEFKKSSNCLPDSISNML